MSNESLLNRRNFDSLDKEIQNLLQEAEKAREFAYAPYSKFKVGACLLCSDHSKYTGCNVENSATVGICAERTAYAKAICDGKRSFKAIAIIAYQMKFITPPCGACLQFMSEFEDVDIYISKPDLEEVFLTSLNQLLPCRFQHNSDFSF